MKLVHSCCAGADVGKDEVVVCLRKRDRRKTVREVRRFPTLTCDLLRLADWLAEAGCTHVAMEATGVYWKPVWHILEERFEMILANAARIKNVPGRKSDMNDASWIAELLAHGLIERSFVPLAPIQELRGLTRTRRQLVREGIQHTQRIQRVLEDANVKLASVISDVLGKSGRRILDAIVSGETDPEKLADLGSERLKCDRATLVEALRGRVQAHHRFLLRQHLQLIADLDRAIAQFDAEIERVIQPFRDVVERLTGIPGVSDTAAHVLIAEIGLDMSRFPTAAHLLSWAGLCPKLDESAGKKRSVSLRKGAPWLKPVLVQCAWAAAKKKNTYLQAQFVRLKSRRGPKKAVVAVAASMLGIAYFMIRDQTPYEDLGADYFTRRDKAKIASRLANRIRDLGYEVDIKQVA